MKKSPSKSAPVKGSSLAEDNPLFWAAHVKLEHNIRSKWLRKYGSQFNLIPPGSQSHQRQGREISRKGLEKGYGILLDPSLPPRGIYPQVQGKVLGHGQAVGQRHDHLKASEMARYYPSSGSAAKHLDLKGSVAPYTSSIGHRSEQYRRQNPIYVKKPTSANDFYLQIRSSPRRDEVVPTIHPDDFDKFKPFSTSFDSSNFEPVIDGSVDLDKLAMQLEGRSRPELHRLIKRCPPSELCPKCENHHGCTCVPRRREKIPEDPGNGPDDVLPPWPPQVWCGPSYNGLRVGTLGDIQRLRYRLSRDPDLKTPMNRMYDEMKAVNYYGDKSHAGEHTYSCGPCRNAHEAARGTWFEEQLKRGNPFTTGDTQFKSCSYMRKL